MPALKGALPPALCAPPRIFLNKRSWREGRLGGSPCGGEQTLPWTEMDIRIKIAPILR